MIEVYLGGHLNYYHPDRCTRLSVPLEQSIPLITLLEQIGIPVGEVAFATLNGNIVELHSTQISPGDRIGLYPPMGGG